MRRVGAEGCASGSPRRVFDGFGPGKRKAGAVLEKFPPGLGHAQRGVFAAVLVQQAFGLQQPGNLLDVRVAQVGHDAVHAQVVVSQLADAFGVGTAQDLADVGDTEPLAGADHGRQDLLGDYGRVELLPGREADVAAPAVVLRPRLAEILQQEFPPASGQAAELDHAFQLVLRVAPLGLVFDPVDEEVLLPLVAVGVEQHALAGQAVAPGAARLLIVAFERLGQVVVHDQPHVGLVDAHAEGDGCHDDERVVADELFLRLAAQRGVQPGVVGQCGQAHRRQAGRDVLGRLA